VAVTVQIVVFHLTTTCSQYLGGIHIPTQSSGSEVSRESRRFGFPPRRPGFESGSGHVGFMVDKVALGHVFSEYFGLPCQFAFHQLLHNHPHLSSGACTLGQKWQQYLVDLVQPH
jgi:hypothetical protein